MLKGAKSEMVLCQHCAFLAGVEQTERNTRGGDLSVNLVKLILCTMSSPLQQGVLRRARGGL